MNLDFGIIVPYTSYLLQALGVTLEATVKSLILGFLLSIPLAWFKISKFKILRGIAYFYTSIFRGVPLLVQVFIMYFAIPQTFGLNLGAMEAGTLTFALNSSAYISETLRGGILSVDRGQTEAAVSLGIPQSRIMFEIIFPQALKAVLPGIVNESITLLKNTSLISTIGAVDLLRAAQMIISRDYVAFEPLITVAVIYYILVMVMTAVSSTLERRLRVSDTN